MRRVTGPRAVASKSSRTRRRAPLNSTMCGSTSVARLSQRREVHGAPLGKRPDDRAEQRTFDVAHSVPVPADLGRRVLGTPDDGTRSTSDSEAQAYAMVAVRKTQTSSARRAIRDGETCYYFVTYLHNVRTGQIVRIPSVVFEGCDSGAPPGGDPGGGVPPPPTPAPLPAGWQVGCNSSTNPQTNERNTALSASAPQMNGRCSRVWKP